MSPLPSRLRSADLQVAARCLHQTRACRTSATARAVRSRPGFTLLEVLLATGLTATLLVAISAALGLFSRYVTAGRDRVAGSQIKRALGERLRHDIQRVIPPTQLSPSANSGNRSDNSSIAAPTAGHPTETHRIRRTPSDAISVTTLQGNEIRLAMTVHRSDGKMPATAVPTSNAERSFANPTTMVERVIWQLGADGAGAVVPGSARGLSRYSSVAPASTPNPSVTTFSAAPQDSETPMFLTEIIPEVTTLRLRYFDGANWHSHWNTAVTGSLPRAIEVVVQLAANPHDQRTALSSERYVFPLLREISDDDPSQPDDRRVTGESSSAAGLRFSPFSPEGTR